MNDSTINSILQNSSMSNFEISATSGTKRYAVSNAQDTQDNNVHRSPSLEELQKKFFGADETNNPDAVKIDLDKFNFESSVQDAADDDVDIRILKSKQEDEVDNINLNERTVIFSKNEGLLGSQG